MRRGRILIRADSVEEAVLMASRFRYQSLTWDDRYEIYAEVAQVVRNKTVDKPSGHGKGFCSKKKKKKRSQKYYSDEFPGDIPF